jgi:7-cyano-7-deazaguanine synthase
MTSKALVLFSGGQDSTVCLSWALARFDHVETIGFDYGQRHRVELEARPGILDALRAMPHGDKLGDDHVMPLDVLKTMGGSALTENMVIEIGASGLPTTFVPGRNILFLTVAAALGYRRGISDLVGGMCETDFSGYPDCRDETIRSMEKTLSLGMGKYIRIHTPLMWIDKAATWKMAETLGGEPLVDLIITDTVTCYEGDPSLHVWGRGCGRCPSCELRARGYKKYKTA